MDSVHLKYLAANPQDLKWGLAINSVGFQDIAPGMQYPPANHPPRYVFSTSRGRVLQEYQLLYIAEGEGVFSSEATGKSRRLPLSAGSMFMLFPGQWHTYQPDPSTGWREYWIGFNGTFADSLAANGFFSREKPTMQVGIQDAIVELYEEAIRVATHQESGFQQLLAGIVGHLLGVAHFYGKNLGFRASEIGDLISKAKIHIAENLGSATPESVAAHLNSSYSKFRKAFKEYTGFSPARYILELKFNKAKEALTNTDLPIKVIAIDSGFDNYEYFFTIFRRLSGMTPARYREMTRPGKTNLSLDKI